MSYTWSTTYEGGYDRQEKTQSGVDSNKNLISHAAIPSREKTKQRHGAHDGYGETQ